MNQLRAIVKRNSRECGPYPILKMDLEKDPNNPNKRQLVVVLVGKQKYAVLAEDVVSLIEETGLLDQTKWDELPAITQETNKKLGIFPINYHGLPIIESDLLELYNGPTQIGIFFVVKYCNKFYLRDEDGMLTDKTLDVVLKEAEKNGYRYKVVID